MEYGILSLLPVCVALVLAFVTKDALLSILIGVLTGIIVSGQNPEAHQSCSTSRAKGRLLQHPVRRSSVAAQRK